MQKENHNLSKEIYYTFFKQTPTPIHIFKMKDEDFVFVDYNRAANKLLQDNLSKYLGLKVSELFKNQPEIINLFKKCFEKKTLIKNEIKYYFKSIDKPKTLFVEFQYIPPNLILVHYEDITKQRIAEERLKNSRAKYHSLFEHSPVGIAIFNENGTLIDSNPMSEIITGYKRKNFIGINFKHMPLFTNEHLSQFKENILDLRSKNKTKLSEIQIKKKIGDLSWILYQISFFKLNKIPYYQCIFQDINDLKRTEQNLKDSKDNYQNLITSIPDIIIKMNFNGEILYINPQVEPILGYKRNHLIGTPYYDLIHPDEVLNFKKAQEEAIETGASISLEYRLKKVDGTYLPVSGRGKLVNNKEKLALLGVIRDISDRKHAERLLEDRIELEHLISNISTQFIFSNNLNNTITNSLKYMAKFIKAKRAYIFLFDENKKYMSNSHEWCAQNIDPQINYLQNIPLKHFPWLINRLKEGDPIHITKFSKVLSEIKSIFKYFETDIIKSILMFPIFLEEKLSGFLGFDDVEETQKWEKEDLSLFQITAEMIGTSLERRLTEKTLKESHTFLEGIIDSIPNYMCIINKNYRIFWANDKVQNIYGENIIGKKCFQVFRRGNKICKDCPAQKTFQDGEIHQEEVLYSYQGQNLRFITTNTNVISKTIDGKAELVVIIGEDITQFKKVEQNFKEYKRKYQLLFEQAEHGIILIDPINKTLIDFNRRAYEYLGYSREEFKQKFFSNLFTESYNESFDNHIEKVLKHIKSGYKTNIRNKMGESIELVIASHLFRIGSKTYIQSIFEFNPNNFNKLI